MLPAYRRLHDYLAKNTCRRRARSVAWSDLPGGDYWYAYLVRYHTSTDMTPDEVHELGLREVARLRAELGGLQGALGVQGEPHAVFDAMRADPKFHFTDPQQLLAGYQALRAASMRTCRSLFQRKPKADSRSAQSSRFEPASAASAEYQVPSADGSRPRDLLRQHATTWRPVPRT